MKKALQTRSGALALGLKRDKLACVSDDHDPPDRPKEKDDPPQAKADDVVMVHSPTDVGLGYHVLRMREGYVELGQIRNMREGAPVHGDVVRLSQRQ